MFGKSKTSGQQENKGDTIDSFVRKMESVPEVIRRASGRLKELEFSYVNELAVKSRQYFERELGVEAARAVMENLRRLYKMEIRDLTTLRQAPGDPEPIDKNYHVPDF